jgi:hypothetical protein
MFLFSTVSKPALGPTQPPIDCVLRAISAGIKGLGREADHSQTSSAEVKNDSYTFTPPYVVMAQCLIAGTTLPYLHLKD